MNDVATSWKRLSGAKRGVHRSLTYTWNQYKRLYVELSKQQIIRQGQRGHDNSSSLVGQEQGGVHLLPANVPSRCIVSTSVGDHANSVIIQTPFKVTEHCNLGTAEGVHGACKPFWKLFYHANVGNPSDKGMGVWQLKTLFERMQSKLSGPARPNFPADSFDTMSDNNSKKSVQEIIRDIYHGVVDKPPIEDSGTFVYREESNQAKNRDRDPYKVTVSVLNNDDADYYNETRHKGLVNKCNGIDCARQIEIAVGRQTRKEEKLFTIYLQFKVTAKTIVSGMDQEKLINLEDSVTTCRVVGKYDSPLEHRQTAAVCVDAKTPHPSGRDLMS